MRFFPLFLPLLIAFPFVGASDAPKAQTKKTVKAILQGDWIVTSLSAKNFQISGTKKRPILLRFKDDKMYLKPSYDIERFLTVTFTFSGLNKLETTIFKFTSQTSVYTYAVNPVQNPCHFDMEEKKEDKVVKYQGIYHIKEDEIKIAFAIEERPSNFEDFDTSVVLSLKRQKKDE